MNLGTEMREAQETFFSESRELLHAMEDTILGLEQQSDATDSINTIFRAARMLKGLSTLFGLDHIVLFTHVVESVVDRKRPTPPSKKLSPPLLSSDFCHEESIWPYRINRITTSKLGKPAD